LKKSERVLSSGKISAPSVEEALIFSTERKDGGEGEKQVFQALNTGRKGTSRLEKREAREE